MNESREYRVFDLSERKVVSAIYNSGKRARKRAEKLNLQYGAHRYYAQVMIIDENSQKTWI